MFERMRQGRTGNVGLSIYVGMNERLHAALGSFSMFCFVVFQWEAEIEVLKLSPQECIYSA